MRYFRILLVAAVAMGSFLLQPESVGFATPGPYGLPVFSVSSIDAAHDITPVPKGTGDTCTSADILFPPIFPIPCAARVAPAPAGPVPDTLTTAVTDLGLNTAGVFTDDLDALSFGETRGLSPVIDYDFSVDPAPANGGVTVGAPPPAACPAVPNVTTEAAALEAQGDIFTTLGVPAGCNQVAPSRCIGLAACDEASLGLIAPNAGPGMPPLDNVDALAEMPNDGGTCVWGGIGRICPAMSLLAGSATIGLAPVDTFTGLAPDAATIFVPPSSVANPPNLAGGCIAGPGATACAAVHSSSLGLLAGDELDALCWFDRNGDRTVDLPTTIAPTGDNYLLSLAPGSPTLAALGYSAADILGLSPAGPVVAVAAGALGLLATDNVDGLTCHLPTTDADGDGYSDTNEDGAPLCAGATNQDAFDDAVVNDGCPAREAAEVACVDAVDSDADTLVNDGCPVVFAFSEGPQCGGVTDDDGDAAVNDGCPARGPAEAICGPAGDDDGDGASNDGCPAVGGGEEANNIGTRPLNRCEPGVGAPSGSWPSDFVSAGIPDSTDSITIGDLASFLAPAPAKYGTTPAMPGYNARWDLVPGPTIGPTWIAINDLTALFAGPSGFPPMPPFLGVKAFGSPLDCFDP